MFRALVQTPSKRDRTLCGIPPPDPATDGRSCHARAWSAGSSGLVVNERSGEGLSPVEVRFRGPNRLHPVTS